MTLCIAWVRSNKRGKKELCMVSDSCLSCGDRFYAAPKLFPLLRGDCAIACAGSTNYFYPIVYHIMLAIGLNKRIADRAVDFVAIKKNVLDIINKTLFEIKEFQAYNLQEDLGPDFTMIFAGYSWKQQQFRIYEIKYNKQLKRLVAYKARKLFDSPMSIIGDSDQISPTSFTISSYIKSKSQNYIDMEPLDVLCDIIRDTTISTIGGYPQMIKVYPFLNTLPFGFIHLDNTGKEVITFMGRPLLDYETFPYPMLDLSTGKIKYMKETTNEFRRKYEYPAQLNVFYKGSESFTYNSATTWSFTTNSTQ